MDLGCAVAPGMGVVSLPTFPHSCVSPGTPGCPAGRDPRTGSLPRDVWGRAALPGHRGDVWHPFSLLPSKPTPFPGSVARGTSGPSCHPGNSLVSTLSREYEQPAAPGQAPPAGNPGRGLFAPLVPSLVRKHSLTRNYLHALFASLTIPTGAAGTGSRVFWILCRHPGQTPLALVATSQDMTRQKFAPSPQSPSPRWALQGRQILPTFSLSVDLTFPLALSGPVASFLLVMAELPRALCWPVMDKSWAATPFFLSKIMTLASNKGTALVIFLQ